ncbi:diacylglycerol/lipid kinase family protein [Ornithinimicrobium faecis]|uniref:Diacylglycerol kinase family lipid kinase n=1 Tax=Ornithinimicrobium faecis TaxID=2934158 RepID=A0ABY4YNX5_9MICO|nr:MULTISPECIES: diacylglycerol kinase family protein [unclassified Ornithinimicrobium]USQ78195.1 diacylglycerol kinase family lipid kinase [Ornithinimicrobium sp. HY1793]
MTRYAVLHGPRSGRRGAGAVGAEVVQQLRAAGQQVTELETATREGAQDVCRRAVEEGVDTLVAVGGDGVVQIAANALVGSETALGIVPAGTGNDNARSVHIPLKTASAVQTLLTGVRRPIDLIHVAPMEQHVVGSVPCGLDALIASRAATLPRWLGAQSYTVATLPEIIKLRPMDYRLELDDRVVETKALVVAVCNMPIYGGGMRIAPDADPQDGLLDVIIIEPVGAASAVRLLRGVFSGKHSNHPAVRFERARRVSVSGPALVAHGDGDPLGPLPVTCTVAPGAIDLVVPTR